MNIRFVLVLALLFLVAATAIISGCTQTQQTPQPTYTQATPAAAEETILPTAEDLEWIVWREGSNTLNALGGYQSYSPNVNGQKFKALKVEVRSNNPVTILFLNDKELSNFEKKMSTNTGEYTTIARYDDVNYKVIEAYSDEYLNVVIWNPGNKLVTADFYIWYKNLV